MPSSDLCSCVMGLVGRCKEKAERNLPFVATAAKMSNKACTMQKQLGYLKEVLAPVFTKKMIFHITALTQ